MTEFTASSSLPPDERRRFGLRVTIVLLVAVSAFCAAVFLNVSDFGYRALLAAGASSLIAAGFMFVRTWNGAGATGRMRDLLAGFIEKDSTPSFVADDDGIILARNNAASIRFSGAADLTLAATLRSIFGNPSAVLFRLQSRARLEGNAREDVVTRRGHIRLSVHSVGEDCFLWRVEDITDRAGINSRADSLPLPMLTIGRSGAVLFMNEAARELVGHG
ncbi:two-component system, cell cycle sensor histidine kinase and response regulator CckA [Ruegeria marina]|uniref:Two-component system, cell cycle sensor histidine kinase and response regulator CckA n=1 Tax=Ruegeria marina TaxID=639004 RepID=A0A1G6Q5C4_9RHOB|nr:two-component system, cell cycle sensor histidine kinase and response regulator CckA [Ruegeria marina]